MKKEAYVVGATGFALFSMFFGSGNLVFPITVGLESEGHYIYASLGILCTCVLFPLLGMLGITLYKGNLNSFFSIFGKKGTFLFSLLALSLMGPFGVLARCLTVIHGALTLVFPSISLGLTSFLMCVIVYALTVNKNRIVTILGTILTPLLLLAIAAIVFCGLNQASIPPSITEASLTAFEKGFFKGYQTMDLVASFFFSGFVIQYLYQANKQATLVEGIDENLKVQDQAKKQAELGANVDMNNVDIPMVNNKELKLFFKASLLGAFLLYIVYFALVMLGWLYAPMLANVAPQEMFGKIALASLGSLAAPFVCLTVVFACLTTAIALTSLFSEFLRNDIAQKKLGNKVSLLITLAIAFLISNLEFSGIANFLAPILETIYPALISLTVVNIFFKLTGVRSKVLNINIH